MKRMTMIGDIGWSRFYHLGDEAMTEFALDALRARADVEITLIAGEPEYAAKMYGVDAVSRIGFKRDRPPNITRMRTILDYAESGGEKGGLAADDPAIRVIETVRNSDAVLIAGGGNLNSMFAQHIFERATLAKLARIFDKPYALTSQTLGPLIYDEDRGIVHDLLAEAEFVGTRESYTTQLAGELGAGDAKIRRQVDDAFSLTAGDADREAVADLTDKPFIVASFAEKASSPMITDSDYRLRVIEIVRRIAEETGLRLLLVPHGGAFAPAPQTRDQLTDAQIADSADNDLVQPTRMLTARQLVALTERAEFVIGTRYHAGIFAGAAAVPFISLAPNLYSSIRMRGAAENVGMRDFVLPLDSIDDIVDTAVGVARNRDSLQTTLRQRSVARREEHRKWWDFLVETTIGSEETRVPGDERAVEHSEAPGFFHADEMPNDYVANVELVRERLNSVQDYGLVMAVKDRRAALARTEVNRLKAKLRRAEDKVERAEARLSRTDRAKELRERKPAVRAMRQMQKLNVRLRGAARSASRFGNR